MARQANEYFEKLETEILQYQLKGLDPPKKLVKEAKELGLEYLLKEEPIQEIEPKQKGGKKE